MAMKRLATAKKLMHPSQEKAFYNEVIRTLWQYVSDKLYIRTSDLSKDNIEQKLLEKQVSEDRISGLLTMLDTCEQALFSQAGQAAIMQETYINAVKWITETDEQLSQKTT
jgi:SOS response regulatory protein OraA/RecX